MAWIDGCQGQFSPQQPGMLCNAQSAASTAGFLRALCWPEQQAWQLHGSVPAPRGMHTLLHSCVVVRPGDCDAASSGSPSPLRTFGQAEACSALQVRAARRQAGADQVQTAESGGGSLSGQSPSSGEPTLLTDSSAGLGLALWC